MSLVNKMLQDLEARRRRDDGAALGELIHSELRPVPAARRRVAPWMLLPAAIALAAVLALALFGRPGEQPPPGAEEEIRAADPERPSVAEAGEPLSEVVATAAREPGATAVDTPEAPVPDAAAATSASAGPVEPPPTVQPVEAASSPAIEPAPQPDAAPAVRLEKRPRALPPEALAERHYRDALARLEADQVAEAVTELEAALSAWPAHGSARELLAGVWLRQGRRTAVEQLLLEGRAVDPDNVPVTMMLARLYVDGGAETRALELLESARGPGKGNPEYLGFLAALLQRAGRHPEAAAAYRAALELRPAEARWWLGLGISLETMRDWPAARDAYARALAGNTLGPELDRYARARRGALTALP